MRKIHFILAAMTLAWLLSACVPREQAQVHYSAEPRLEERAFLPGDGARLPLAAWLPEGDARAVIVYAHGFNDYSHGAALPAAYLAKSGIATYAYDQRSFGANAETGVWPGEATLAEDLRRAVAAARATHPGTPVFVMGESMGGAVAIVALTQDAPQVDGLILIAPAVWGEGRMNPLFRAAGWLTAHTFPFWRFSGRGLHVMATDNMEIAREIAHDKLFIKETRADAILSLVRLMDDAHARMKDIRVPTLLLYGAHDEIIPETPISDAARSIPGVEYHYYPNGYHLLLRDLQREAVMADVAAWIDRRLQDSRGFSQAP